MVIRLDVTESGLTALVRLCSGDMRKALNILQVIALLSNRYFLALVGLFQNKVMTSFIRIRKYGGINGKHIMSVI